MNDLSSLDSTQAELKRHLAVTERLLARAVSKESGTEHSAQITLMPDLGIPFSVSRILGGFATGALYQWKCAVPFVPVDSTVNVCSVSVYRTDQEFSCQAEFNETISRAKKETASESSYLWNYDAAHGNHFITYGEVAEGQGVASGRYLVLHSSACEFKKQSNGLYPSSRSWFADRIRVFEESESGRWIRYIVGSTAERFYRQARLLEEFNRVRHQYFAELILGTRHCLEETLSIPHYGMPTSDSVAIGCQWLDVAQRYLLLTAPSKPLYFIDPKGGGRNSIQSERGELLLQPHGLGIRYAGSLELSYEFAAIRINGRRYEPGASLKGEEKLEIRGSRDRELDGCVERILSKCPGRVSAVLRPLYSYPTSAQFKHPTNSHAT